ncbi:MAG: hypothetical protein AABY91_04900 [Gemmatimonadota bacterium]
MAIDRALLDLAIAEGSCLLRLYRWEPHCLSFGRHEPVLKRYGRERIEALGVDCVRRPTGGRAVWHARELTYAVAAPNSFGSLPAAYQRIHEMLGNAVRGLGAPVTLAAPPGRIPTPSDGACFAAPVGGELLVAGRKVLGSAQVRGDGGLLQHGALLLGDDQRMVHQLAGSETLPAPEAPLSTLLGRRVEFAEAAAAIRDAAAGWSDTWEPIDQRAVEAGAEAYQAQFKSDAWTWAR